MEVEPETYMPKTVEYCQFINRFLVTVKETGQTWNGEDDFILEKPKLTLKVNPPSPRVNRPLKVTVRMTNPLENDLTACIFALEGPGLTSAIKKSFRSVMKECIKRY